MVESSNEELQRQKLEAEREKLTAEQREQHDRFCDLLNANETYSSDVALKAAGIIATEGDLRKASELKYLLNRAEDLALDEQRRGQAESDRQAQKAEQQRIAQEQENARLAAQESEQLARANAERDEVVPKPWTGNGAG